MLEKLFNIFRFKKSKPKKPELPPDTSHVCKLEFGINKDGTVDITCYWPEFSESSSTSIINIAYFYALAIHAINNGLLEKEILDTLQKNSTYDEYDTLFAHNVVYKLYELEKQKKYRNGDISKDPLVFPLDVFKNMSHQ
jgi:hypothetical protein